jgi:glucosyl-dolichyl phosphate glucuronosyltransferase
MARPEWAERAGSLTSRVFVTDRSTIRQPDKAGISDGIRPTTNSREAPAMFTTVVICTFNRSSLLDNTLGQLGQLELTGCDEWELIVVNNNCSDDTDAVIRRHSNHLPLRHLWEPRPGKSYAANLAVQEARGDLILWVDDDVLVGPRWLSAYVEAAHTHPDVSFFGGPIIPWFETKPPAWISCHLRLISGCFAAQAPFDEPFTPISSDRLPYGANMGMRRHCFEHGSFDTNLGPVGRRNYQDEEIVLLQTLLDRGQQGLWVREASVQHFIPTARLTEAYVWQFHSCYGRTRVRRGDTAVRAKQLFGLPRWLVRKYVTNLVACKFWSPTKNERWMQAFRKAATYAGMISELREQNAFRRTSSQTPLRTVQQSHANEHTGLFSQSCGSRNGSLS